MSASVVTEESRESWRKRLAMANVPLTGEVDWSTGGWSLYFDDPDGHVVELKSSDWSRQAHLSPRYPDCRGTHRSVIDYRFAFITSTTADVATTALLAQRSNRIFKSFLRIDLPGRRVASLSKQ